MWSLQRSKSTDICVWVPPSLPPRLPHSFALLLPVSRSGCAGSGDVSVARVAFHLGVCLRRAGRRQEAERVLSGCVETLKDKLGEDNEEVATAQEVLDACAATE